MSRTGGKAICNLTSITLDPMPSNQYTITITHSVCGEILGGGG